MLDFLLKSQFSGIDLSYQVKRLNEDKVDLNFIGGIFNEAE